MFAETVQWLSGGAAAALTHADLEEQLGERGRELLRRLHQDHLDLRAAREQHLHPADAALNLPEEKHSHGVRKLAAIESARGSFESAAQAITRATGMVIGKRQVEELARRAAADIDAFCTARQPGPRPDDELRLRRRSRG